MKAKAGRTDQEYETECREPGDPQNFGVPGIRPEVSFVNIRGDQR